jgi:hypothetical protein
MKPWLIVGVIVVGLVGTVRWLDRVGATRFLAQQPKPGDPSFVDAYLVRWDRFAQGDNRLVPYIREYRAAFEKALSDLIREKPMDGAIRAGFYAIVQVGGFIEIDSDLGQALSGALGDRVRSRERKKTGTRVLFAGDLYKWLIAERASLPPFPLFDEWRSREFAKMVAIPMYERVLTEGEEAP